ncbi:TPA: hypothetical protein ACN3ZQ_003565 [Vibrio cholerae]|uniref:hypothetical protein n=1 Tax=Vibrio cholerae TaxID=666 RepID=UPI001582F612|nr:hypothetical protein [Vibrio cholerae]QKU57460.1 hypothetical protein HPY04_15440 [Vibrio cholerae]GHY97849.1 hypothetical protein VCSRO121_3464 [Vibrio cholerae]
MSDRCSGYTEEQRNKLRDLEHRFDLGLWEYQDGLDYGFILTGNRIWLTPESYLSY